MIPFVNSLYRTVGAARGNSLLNHLFNAVYLAIFLHFLRKIALKITPYVAGKYYLYIDCEIGSLILARSNSRRKLRKLREYIAGNFPTRGEPDTYLKISDRLPGKIAVSIFRVESMTKDIEKYPGASGLAGLPELADNLMDVLRKYGQNLETTQR